MNAFRRTRIASDWHLGQFSGPIATQLALDFLEHAATSGDDVILNGDVFEGLFETAASAEAAQPRVTALIDDLARAGRLRRTEGNHDPGSGEPSVIVEHPALGRVLVTHGHTADPMHRSLALRVGDGISRRCGRFAPVRGAAWLAESIAGVAGGRVEAVFRERCLALVDAASCDLGVFGHVHRERCTPGDRYLNAGCLRRGRLAYLVLDDAGVYPEHLERVDDLAHRERRHGVASRGHDHSSRRAGPGTCSPG
ncbi:MAG: metallophosphoesterase [Gemmatimonadaceae bacterium]